MKDRSSSVIAIRAAVLCEPPRPLRVEMLKTEGPRKAEVLVRLVASGICHTDIDFCDSGGVGPAVLGHEGAGVVERLGKSVKALRVGDYVVLWRVPRPATIRTDEETIELLRRLAVHHSDTVIAAVLNRQGRETATGESFTANRVASLRKYWKILCYQAPATPPQGELLTVRAAANQLGVAAATLLRWLNDGFVAGEQVTPGAPWRIRMTKELRSLIVPEVPQGYVIMPQAMRILGVSRQTIMQRVKRGVLSVVHVSRGKQKGLRIRFLDNQPQLFDQPAAARV